MKPYFDESIHIVASEAEIRMIRVALSVYKTKYAQLVETKEDKEYLKELEQLYKDTTRILEILPF